jgi:hypothetical protein
MITHDGRDGTMGPWPHEALGRLARAERLDPAAETAADSLRRAGSSPGAGQPGWEAHRTAEPA